jgi:hypothetical protein
MTDTKHKNDTDDRTEPVAEGRLDVEDQLTHDRLTAIRDRRNTALDARHQSRLAALQNDMTEDEANLWYREALESLLLELRPYRDTDEVAASYWTGRNDPLGHVTADPPDEDPFTDEDPIHADTIHGLNDVIAAPTIYTVTFETQIKTRHGPDLDREEDVRTTIPRFTLDAALSDTFDYARHLGLDIDVEDEEAEWEV